jgi:hypothetical protein
LRSMVEVPEQDNRGFQRYKNYIHRASERAAWRAISVSELQLSVCGVVEDQRWRAGFRRGAAECYDSRLVRRFHVYHWRSSISVSIIFCAVPVISGFETSIG